MDGWVRQLSNAFHGADRGSKEGKGQESRLLENFDEF